MKKSNVYTLLLAILSICTLNAQQVELIIPDMTVEPGEVFQLDIKASDFDNIESMQFALYWNPATIQFQSVSNLNPNMPDFSPTDNFNLMNVASGRFRTIWFWFDPVTNTGVTLDDNATLFSVNFKAVGTQGTNTLVEITHDTLTNPPLEIQLGSDGQGIDFSLDNGKVTISGVNASEESLTEDFTLFQNNPNPFANLTYISFNLKTGAEGKLTIFDNTGKIVYQENKKYPAGLSRIPVRRDMLASAGSYFYTLETARATATRQLIMQ